MVKVYSTFSRDKILDANNKAVSVKKGGPALFIEGIFKKYKVKYLMNTGNVIDVEIKVTENGETGEIISELKENKIKGVHSNDVVLISTIGKEWLLDNSMPAKKIFLDIQGYMRVNKTNTFFHNNFWEKIYCIKGTEKEIKRLPSGIRSKQKEKCLIVTKGKRGSVIYFKGKKHNFYPEKIDAKNTIGAGDVFFAAFAIKFIETNDVIASGNFATREAEVFLKLK